MQSSQLRVFSTVHSILCQKYLQEIFACVHGLIENDFLAYVTAGYSLRFKHGSKKWSVALKSVTAWGKANQNGNQS